MQQRIERRAGVRVMVAGLLTTLVLAGCDGDANAPDSNIVPESELQFVRIRAGAPPLETMDTSFWAVKGQDRKLKIRFQGQEGPGSGQEFLELVIAERTLLRRPDGRSFADGDSIEIRVVIDPDFYLASFEPTGLVFDPDEPAKLELDYEEAEDEFLDREMEFDVWRQERPGEPWERIGSAQLEEIDEIEAILFGFTRYALAIGR